jgi:hypothetical protein
VPQADKHLPQSPLTGQYFYMTTFYIVFYKSYLSALPILGAVERNSHLIKLAFKQWPVPFRLRTEQLPPHWASSSGPFEAWTLPQAGINQLGLLYGRSLKISRNEKAREIFLHRRETIVHSKPSFPKLRTCLM